MCDIATPRNWTGRARRAYAHRRRAASGTAGVAALLAGRLPPGLRLLPARAQARSLQDMTRAFELNLRALSLLALMVGVFLVYNTMTFSVVQRRELIATLRTLGATRGQVFRAVLTEALRMALLGTLLGLFLGALLARELSSSWPRRSTTSTSRARRARVTGPLPPWRPARGSASARRCSEPSRPPARRPDAAPRGAGALRAGGARARPRGAALALASVPALGLAFLLLQLPVGAGARGGLGWTSPDCS